MFQHLQNWSANAKLDGRYPHEELQRSDWNNIKVSVLAGNSSIISFSLPQRDWAVVVSPYTPSQTFIQCQKLPNVPDNLFCEISDTGGVCTPNVPQLQPLHLRLQVFGVLLHPLPHTHLFADIGFGLIQQVLKLYAHKTSSGRFLLQS